MMRQRQALAMAAKAFRVFPCTPNAKEPACYWQQEATTEETVIREWFKATPDMNYGVAMDHRHFVLDLDCKGERDGIADLANREFENSELRATFTVKTPSGGEHLYLVGSAPNSVCKKELGQGIDVRGDGGYVLGPGSVIDGKPYTIMYDCEIVSAPDWLLQLAAKRTVEPAKRDPNVALDAPGEIDRMQEYLIRIVAQGDVAIEHCGGNDRTYRLFNLILDHVSQDVAYDLVAEIWNPACVPPWSDNELRTVLGNAIAYRQNDIGAKATPPATEVFKEALANLPPPKGAPIGKLLRSVSFAALMERPIKPVEEVIPGLIEKGVATMLAGPGGTHKSRLAQQIGLSIQAGVPIFGKITEPCTFVYLDYENGEAEITRRTHTMRSRLGLHPDTAGHYFDLKGGLLDANKGPLPASQLSPPLALIEETGVTCLPLYFELHEFLRSIPGHKFVVGDSCYNLLNFTGQTKINESSVKAALNLLDYLCQATDSTLIYLWHPSQAGMERGDATGWSVAWHNTPRARLSLSKADNTPDGFELKVEKRNNGPAGGIITLHWRDGILLPLSAIELAKQPAALFEACVAAALTAAESGSPIQRQRKVTRWLMDDIERAVGKMPTDRQVKEQLEAAIGKQRLRYIPGHGKQMAGYYPWTTDAPTMRLLGVDTSVDNRVIVS
jgi:hypothetical protein